MCGAGEGVLPALIQQRCLNPLLMSSAQFCPFIWPEMALPLWKPVALPRRS